MSSAFTSYYYCLKQLFYEILNKKDDIVYRLIKSIFIKEKQDENIEYYKRKKNDFKFSLSIFKEHKKYTHLNNIKNVLINIFDYSDENLERELMTNKLLVDENIEILLQKRNIISIKINELSDEYDTFNEDEYKIDLFIDKIINIIIMNRIYIFEYRQEIALRKIFNKYETLEKLFDGLIEYIYSKIDSRKLNTIAEAKGIKIKKDKILSLISKNKEPIVIFKLDESMVVFGFYYCLFRVLFFLNEKKKSSEKDKKDWTPADRDNLSWIYKVQDIWLRNRCLEYFKYWFGIEIRVVDMNLDEFVEDVYYKISKYWSIDQVPSNTKEEDLTTERIKILFNIETGEKKQKRIDINIFDVFNNNTGLFETQYTDKCDFERFFNNLMLKIHIINSGNKNLVFIKDLHELEVSWLYYFARSRQIDQLEIKLFHYYLDNLFSNILKYKSKNQGEIKKHIIAIKVDWSMMMCKIEEDVDSIKERIEYFKTVNENFEKLTSSKEGIPYDNNGIDGFLSFINYDAVEEFNKVIQSFLYIKSEEVWNNRKNFKSRIEYNPYFQEMYFIKRDIYKKKITKEQEDFFKSIECKKSRDVEKKLLIAEKNSETNNSSIYNFYSSYFRGRYGDIELDTAKNNKNCDQFFYNLYTVDVLKWNMQYIDEDKELSTKENKEFIKWKNKTKSFDLGLVVSVMDYFSEKGLINLLFSKEHYKYLKVLKEAASELWVYDRAMMDTYHQKILREKQDDIDSPIIEFFRTIAKIEGVKFDEGVEVIEEWLKYYQIDKYYEIDKY